MGKRSAGFERAERDFYRTPEAALLPLLPHLPPATEFVEPCAGDGALIRHLEKHGHVCVDAFDTAPQDARVERADALTTLFPAEYGEMCITNPPWNRKVLHPLIDHWRAQMTTWFLFDADWMHTRQSAPFMPYCHMIVSVGRVKWIEYSNMTGKDNCCWYQFRADFARPQFFGRT